MGERRLCDSLAGYGCRGANPRKHAGRFGRRFVKDISEIGTATPHLSAGVTQAVAGASRQTPLWATLVGTFFGIGRMRPGPGTWGSATTVLFWAALAYNLAPGLRMPVAVGLAAMVTLIGIPAATQV